MAKLFFSYSHKDEALRDQLETHLAMLKRQGVLSSWHDRRIPAGKVIDSEIDKNLDSSDIILLLVSPDFIASDYCYEKEMKRALEHHESGSAKVVPVILRPCEWHGASFGKLRATPRDGKPITTWNNQDEAFLNVARDIRQALSSERHVTDEPPSSAEPLAAAAATVIRSRNLRIKRTFSQKEADDFLHDSFDFIARFFEASLRELQAQNPHTETRFERLTPRSFAASVYSNGERIARCAIWHGGGLFSRDSIAYSQSDDAPGNSYNETMSVTDDGYEQRLKPLGMPMVRSSNDEPLTKERAAEYYWELLIRPLRE